jgi:anti-anti-sigma regulatory factor
MLKIQRSGNGAVVFALSGRMDEEDVVQLEALIRSELIQSHIILDLKDLTLVGRDAIGFLERWEAKGIELKNCADYVREWITRIRGDR